MVIERKPPSTRRMEPAGLLSLLVSLGILRVSEFPLPAADATDVDDE